MKTPARKLRSGPLLFTASILFPAFLSTQVAFGQANGKFQSGEEAFTKVCAYCHMTGVGPMLMGRKLPPQYFFQVARRGLKAMPSFASSFIDDKTLEDLGRYLSTAPKPAK